MIGTVYWYGGSPCAGKSTLAARLANEWGLRHYCCDDHLGRHIAQAAARGQPTAGIAQQVDHEYVFMRSHTENLRFTQDIYREILPEIMADLIAAEEAVLAEGAALLPAVLAGLGIRPERVFFQVPCEDFQRSRYRQRSWIHERLQETSDPERAFENWMIRDASYARWIAAEAIRHGYVLITVDDNTDFEALHQRIAAHFAPATP